MAPAGRINMDRLTGGQVCHQPSVRARLPANHHQFEGLLKLKQRVRQPCRVMLSAGMPPALIIRSSWTHTATHAFRDELVVGEDGACPCTSGGSA
jgi:hypothetical protein